MIAWEYNNKVAGQLSTVRIHWTGGKNTMSGLNWDKKFALEQTEDDEELLQELFTILKQSCSSDMALIRRGIDDNNASQVRCAAHSIKGASASLGISSLRDMALSIELDAKNGKLDNVKDKVPQLSGMIEELKSI